MKKLTPKQRAEIYLKVAKMNDYVAYACGALEDVSNVDRKGKDFSWMLETYFPEFLLFKPKLNTPSRQVWFENSDDRLNALLFSYHMALDAKE